LKKNAAGNRDKAASLLALALNKEAGSRCPQAEKLASFIEGKCTVMEKEEVLNHLADCDQCYALWYSLKTSSQKRRTGGKIYYLTREKILAFAGSALAIAASVAMVVHLVREPMVGGLKENTAVKIEAVDGEKAVSPMPVQTRRVDKVFKNEEKIMPSAPAPVLLETGKSSSSSVQNWLNSVETGCRERYLEERFWKRQFNQGKRLTVRFENDTAFINSVLLLFPEEFDQNTVKNQCEKILQKLARRKESR